MNRKTFTIRFTSPKNQKFPIFSLLIKLFDNWKDASHVQLCWQSKEYDEPLIYEASGLNIHFLGSEYCKEDHWYIEHVFEVTVSDEVAHNTIKWCMQYAGLSYDLKAVFGFAWVIINKWFGKSILNPWGKSTKKQFCSELIGHIMQDVWGMNIPVELNSAGPKALFQYLSEATIKSKDVIHRIDLGRRKNHG